MGGKDIDAVFVGAGRAVVVVAGVAKGALVGVTVAAGDVICIGAADEALLLMISCAVGGGTSGVGGVTSAMTRGRAVWLGGPFTRKPTNAPAATAPTPMPSDQAIT
jgi:hypothetical protein